MPTVVSFYGGEPYYFAAANTLAADCDRLGLSHDIMQIETQGLRWPEICRLKIKFYEQMHRRHGAILWVDVDSRLLNLPSILSGSHMDMMGYVGRLTYIRDYDPYEVTRFWLPSILYFGHTELAARFLMHMVELDRKTDESVTDDWILHEAWLTHSQKMNVAFFSPTTIADDVSEVTKDTLFIRGRSGHVAEFKGQVKQHQPRLEASGLRARALAAESVDAMKLGERTTALNLAERAYRYRPYDRDLAIRWSNYLQIDGRSEESEAVLLNYEKQYPDDELALTALVKRAVGRRDFLAAEAHLDSLRSSPKVRNRSLANSLAIEFEFDRRAHIDGIDDADRPRTWWHRGHSASAVGDILGPWIVDQITGIPPKWCRRDQGLLVGGNTLSMATGEQEVWGSGILQRGDTVSPEATIKSVRGPLSYAAVTSSGGRCAGVFGDPAMLLPTFIPRRRKEARFEVGLIRHERHLADDVAMQHVKDISLVGSGVEVIKRVINEIQECESVLSTSVYGVMIANAYGIPARWCVAGNRNSQYSGDRTEFEDYFGSVGIATQVPLDLSEEGRLISPAVRSKIPTVVDSQFDAEAYMEGLLVEW